MGSTAETVGYSSPERRPVKQEKGLDGLTVEHLHLAM